MAICLLKAQPISRSQKGYTNMLDVASYRSEEVFEKQSFIQKAFEKKERCLAEGIELPEGAEGKELKDRKTLWEKVEKSETRKNSRLARELVCGLPKELSVKDNIKIIKHFVKKLNKEGMVCDWALHKGNANGNIHCHILTTTRKIENNNFTSKVREWDKKDFLDKLKKEWCYSVNPILEKRTKKLIHHKIGIDEKPKAPNLKVKEYHLIKRLISDSLKNKKYQFKIDENFKVVVNYNLGLKTKRTERKANKYFSYFAAKYNADDLAKHTNQTSNNYHLFFLLFLNLKE